MVTHVLFEGSPGVIARDGAVTVEGIDDEGIVAAAVRAAATADRVELCGGLPVESVAAVIAAVGHTAEVRANRYGFESLEQVAAYKTAFAEGSDAGREVFFYRSAATTPLESHGRVLIAGVQNADDLAERAREALRRGAAIVELYGGLGAVDAATVRSATKGRLPVGYID